MTQIDNLDKLNSASYFTKNTLQQVIDVNDNSLYSNIKRWLNQAKLIQLKRGMYVTENYRVRVQDKQAYCEFISNKLKVPSYLSLEYVLQKYGILSESTFSFTSISLKRPYVYSNKFGIFSYSILKEELFIGYRIINKSGFKIKEATKAKALFDFFYLKLLNKKDISNELLDSFRLNLDEFTNKDMAEFKKYIKISKLKKLEKVSLWLKT